MLRRMAWTLKSCERDNDEEIKNNAWVTVNNDFWVTSEANRITSDPKIVIHGNECIILFLTRYWCPEHSIPPKQLSIADLAVVAKDSLFWFSIVTSPPLICDVTRI